MSPLVTKKRAGKKAMSAFNDFMENLEKKIGLNVKYYFKNLSFLMSSGLFYSICGLFLSVMFSIFLSKELYGQYAYAMSIISTLTFISLPGVNIATTRATAKGYDGAFIVGLKLRMKWSLLGSLALLLIGLYYFANESRVLSGCLVVGALAFPLYYSSEVLYGYLDGKRLFNKSAKYRSIIRGFSTIATATAIYLTGNVIIIMVFFFFTVIFLRMVFILKYTSKVRDYRVEKDFASFSGHLTAMNLFSNIAMNFDSILLANLIGFRELAIYEFATILPERIRGIMKSIGTIALPRLSVMDESEIRIKVTKNFLKLLVACGGLFVSYILSAPLLFQILFPRYEASIYYSQIYALILLTFPTTLLSTSFKAKKKIKELYIISFYSIITRLVLFPFLIPLFGIMGAVVTVLIAKAGGFILHLILFLKAWRRKTVLSRYEFSAVEPPEVENII